MDEATRRAQLVAAAQARLDAGDVPSPDELAATIGVSRSTYYRLVGGSHQAFLRTVGWVEEPGARARLLDATAALLDEVGLSGLVMDTVAERAGVGRSTLYRLFPGKAELLAALAQQRAPLAALSQVLAVGADQPPAQLLPGLVAAAVPRLVASRGMLRAVFAEATTAGADGGAGRQVVAAVYAGLVAYVRGQMAAGRLRQTNPLMAVQALLGPLLLQVVVQPDFWTEVDADAAPPEQMVSEFVQLWLRGMQPEPPTAAD
jgi:AcrR family transcriptional regulator